jgi:hypothetical protein
MAVGNSAHERDVGPLGATKLSCDLKPSLKPPDCTTVFVWPTSASILWSFELFERFTGPAASSVSLYSFRTSYRLSGLVFRILGYRSGGPGSIPGTTRIKKK